MIGLLSMRREIRGRDGRVFRLDFNVQSDHMSAVYQFFALAVDVVKFDLRRRCGDLWDGSGLPHVVDPSLECVPDSLFLVDAVLETMVHRLSDECFVFCSTEVWRWNRAGRISRRFEPEEL